VVKNNDSSRWVVGPIGVQCTFYASIDGEYRSGMHGRSHVMRDGIVAFFIHTSTRRHVNFTVSHNILLKGREKRKCSVE